ncbi:DUF3618 domain-containing protein [Streptomyces sp. 8N706]|uniref:DUF3618 domain-containing protein n=1 Tax=Streptomyces sp. 8N706 TaxID=3457416 RepID=UPI003FD61CE6
MTKTPDELRGQVAEARERLGATVEELASRADVKGMAQHKVAEMREQVQQTASHAAHAVHDRTPEQLRTAASKAAETGRRRPAPVVAGTCGVLLLAVLLARGRHEQGRAGHRARAGRRR